MEIGTSNIYTRNCLSCKPVDLAEEQRTLFTSKHWRCVLRTDDQSWLGRCLFIYLKHCPNEEISSEALLDLNQCRMKVCRAFKELFNMTYDNWAQLGNLTRDHEGKLTADPKFSHPHYHLIPRNEFPVEYNGRIFTDVQFGMPLNIDPARGHQKVVLPPEEILALRNHIREKMLALGLISEKDLIPREVGEGTPALDIKNQSYWPLLGAAVFAVVASIFGFMKSR